MRITASHLVNWANTHNKEAQTELPRWIRKLCYERNATQLINFPAGDSTFRPGWDGVLHTAKGSAWIPEGLSYWEIGCTQDVSSKADDDFNKRSNSTQTEERAQATFVFVTPRRWLAKAEWVKEQNAKNLWLSVRVLDADDLEQWLEQTPAVALELAEFLGLSGTGVESLEHYWQRWAEQSEPTITTQAFFTDRAEICKKLQELACELRSEKRLITLQADSVEEAVAFAVASLLALPELAACALVVTETIGWRYVQANPAISIVVAANAEVAVAAEVPNQGLCVIPIPIGDLGQKHNVQNRVLLERANIYDFEKALLAIGVEDSDAKRAARANGRSWSVWRRSNARNPAICHPEWLNRAESNALLALCLLGSWENNNCADQKIVGQITGETYTQVEASLRRFLGINDSPVLLIGNVWKAKSPLELLNLFGQQITQAQLERFFNQAKELLSTPNPELELPEAERYMANIKGKVLPFSRHLFESLCDTLIKLAVRGSEIEALANLNIEQQVNNLIRQLINDADVNRWLSLASYLPALAEAAPSEFLQAVEKSLGQAEASVTRLITETSGGGFGHRCWHAELLWALEVLAWSPRYLPRVALILLRLTRVPYTTNWGNTPISSLRNIFLLWLPQTAANISIRESVLNKLVSADQEMAYQLLSALTDTLGMQMIIPNASPKWRDLNAGTETMPSWAEQRQMYLGLRAHLYNLSSGNVERIAKLLNNTDIDDETGLNKVLELMQPFTFNNADEREKIVLQAAIRRKIYLFDKAEENKLKTNTALQKINILYKQLTPINIVLSHEWLFSKRWLELDTASSQDYEAQQACSANLRTNALTKIYAAQGMSGIEQMINCCKCPDLVGGHLAKANPSFSLSDWAEWIVGYSDKFGSNLPVMQTIKIFIINLPEEQRSVLLESILAYSQKEKWDTDKMIQFLLIFPFEKPMWELATQLNHDIEQTYWKIVPVPFLKADVDKLVLEKLIAVDRPRTILNIPCIYEIPAATPSLLFQSLTCFLQGKEANAPLPDSWNMVKVIEKLEASNEIDRDTLIGLEFNLFPIFHYEQNPPTKSLFTAVSTQPEIFTELICLCFKPRHSDKAEDITPELQQAAEIAYRLLRTCKQQPGTLPDGAIDPEAFISFIEAVREQCTQKDRLEIGEEKLGELIAHAPANPDGSWPLDVVCQVLDRSDYANVRSGFWCGVMNKRGITSRGCFAGGEQERKLVRYYRECASRVAIAYPLTAEVLEELAQHYERDAIRHDNDANLSKEGM